MRLGFVGLIWLWCVASMRGQTVTVYVAPFQSTATGEEHIGKKVGIILNLQIWQTLRIPPAGPGRSSRGGVLWDTISRAPTTDAEASALAKTAQPEDPQIIVWGKTWPFANQNVVEAFLLIRRDVQRNQVGFGIWRVAMPNGMTFAVDVPRWQVDFAPIVLRSDLLPELSDPAGLKLFAAPTGYETRGYVGDSFRALEQNGDSAKVLLPDGKTGWVRLPNISRNPSELVNYTGAIIRIFRQDWAGANALFQRVVSNTRAPLAARIDSYLYLAICADKTGQDSTQWVRKAYDLDPLSKIVIQYLCMSHLSAFVRVAENNSQNRIEQLKLLSDIAMHSEPLFSPSDTWFARLKAFLSKAR
jgi:hypothetical protein